MTCALRRLLTTAVAALVVSTVLAAGPRPAAAAEGVADADHHGSRPSGAVTTTRPAGGTWPLSPEPSVVRDFEPPASLWGPGHRGVDLQGRVGQRVRAAATGVVTFAGRLAGRGVVVVTHGRTRTTYEPVTASVTVGDRVGRGAALGRLELLGSHCLPAACLHWGLLEGERYLDPLTLVGEGPVRLLPWLTGIASSTAVVPGPVPQLPSWRPLGEAALFRD